MLGRRRNKSGKLCQQLGVGENGRVTGKLIDVILKAKIGSTITNPSKSGKRRIKVTKLLARRCVLTKNLRKGREK